MRQTKARGSDHLVTMASSSARDMKVSISRRAGLAFITLCVHIIQCVDIHASILDRVAHFQFFSSKVPGGLV